MQREKETETEKERENVKEKTYEKDKEDTKIIDPPDDDSLSDDNSKRLQSRPSQEILDKKNSKLNLNDNSLSSDEQEKKDNVSNNNTISDKISLEPSSKRESTTTAPKPFNKNGLLSKCHLKLATYIEQNKDVTLAGTKRFTDKSGEYYLKNVQLKKKGQEGALTKKLTLRNPQTLENCFSILNGNLNKIKKKATKIITILPENSLTPIPVKEKNAVRGVAGVFNKKQYQNAERTAVFIRRMEYSSGVQKHLRVSKKNEENINKIILIQEWWKTMYKIIRLQKCVRGFLFRRKLMKNLEHQERLLQFITEFDNIHGYHLYKQFFTNFKDLVNQIKSKQIEMLEDFSEKMEKLEKKNFGKRLKNRFLLWKQKAEEIKKMEKAKNFYERKLKQKSISSMKKSYKFKKMLLKLVKNNINDDKKNFLDKLHKNKIMTDNNYTKAVSKLNKLFKDNDNNLKKETFDKMKLFDFIDHLNDIKDALDDKHKKLFLDKLKQINDYYKKKDSFRKWKSTIEKNKIFKKLIRVKKKELENKKKFTIDSNVNNLNVLDKNNSPDKSKNNEISISNENSINILKKDSPQKILSIGNAGLDFSIIAPEIYYIGEVYPSQKIIKKQNLNDVFEQTKNVIPMLKLKKHFDDWKNKLYLKKILNDLEKNKKKENQEKEEQLNKRKNKLLRIIGNKLKNKKFGGLDDNDKLLEKAFLIWKSLEISLSKNQNIKKYKIKLVRNKKDEGTQINLEKPKYSIDPLVNNFEIISKEENKNNEWLLNNKNKENQNQNELPENENQDENDKNGNNNNELIPQNIINDNILNNGNDNANDNNNDNINNINNDNVNGDKMICRNESFMLKRVYSKNENANDGSNINAKAKKRLPKKLYIQKDNSFSIINKTYIDDEIKPLDDEYIKDKENNKDDNKDLNNPDTNKLNNDNLNNDKLNNDNLDNNDEIEKYKDMNKINEINEFFPGTEKDEEIVYLYEKTDNFFLGPNSSEILIDNLDTNKDKDKDIINEDYDDKLLKLSKRKIKPFNNNEICQNELFSIICQSNKNDNDNENILKNKNNLDKLKGENSDLIDEINYKLYHADKFTLWPKDYIPTEDEIPQAENESDKIVDLPKITLINDNDEKRRILRKPFNNLIMQNAESFSILGNDKNKINLNLDEEPKLPNIKNDIITEQLDTLNNEIKNIKPELYRIRKNKIGSYIKNKKSPDDDNNNENNKDNNIDENASDLNNENKDEEILVENKNLLIKLDKEITDNNDNDNLDNEENKDNNIPDNNNINNINENKKYPNYNIYTTEKIDLEFEPNQTSGNKNDKPKREENRIVKNNNLKIYDISDVDNKNKQNVNFQPENQDIQKFDVLIQPDPNKAKKDDKYSNIIVRTYNDSIYPENKIEKIDNENQTLNDEYIISKPSKNDFSIYSEPNQKNLLFNNERTQFDSINSFSIKIDKKKINKNDLIKGIKGIVTAIKKNIFKNLTDLIKDKINNDNKNKSLCNIIQKRNDNALLKKYFDDWKNLRERELKRVLENIFKKKLNLKKMLNDLSNNNNDNDEAKNFILKHYLLKWKVNALNSKNNKKRISIRKKYNTKKRNKKSLLLLNIIKKQKKQKKLLKKYFNKWKENALNSDNIITHKNILQKLIDYLKKKQNDDLELEKEKEKIKQNEELYNKLKKALLQSLLRKYKDIRNKILQKYFNKWKQNAKNNKKYVKKIVGGNSTYRSKDKKNTESSINNSNMESSSSIFRNYYPQKINKFNSIDRLKKNHNVLNINNIKQNKNTLDKYKNEDLIKNRNIPSLDYKSYSNMQSAPNKILEKIKNRTEKFSNELKNNIFDNSDPNGPKNLSMLQRIQQMYHSPNSSANGSDNNLYTYRTDIYTNPNNQYNQYNQNNKYKKKKKNKAKQKMIENLNKELEEKKEQYSDDSSINNSMVNGIKLEGEKYVYCSFETFKSNS